MGDAHANALARLPMFFPDAPDVDRHVIVGRDEAALATAADRLGFSETTTDWREAIEQVDVFYNLGPNHLHVEPTIEALEQDVHVLCEKPLAHTLDAAERMGEAARTSDAVAGIGFNYRYVPAVQYAKGLIDSGTFGEIRHLRCRYLQDWLVDPEEPWSWRTDRELAGSGSLGDLGSHMVDLIRFLTGDLTGEIERVAGHLKTFTEDRPVEGSDEVRAVTVDDACSSQLTFKNGAFATVEASRVAPGHKNDLTLELHGTDGGFKFSLERLNELSVLRGDQRGYETILVTDEGDPFIDAWWPPGHVLGWEHTFVHQSAMFLHAVASGEAYRPNFADGVQVQRVLDAIDRSDDEGGWIRP